MGRKYEKFGSILWAAYKLGRYPNMYVGVDSGGRIMVDTQETKNGMICRRYYSRRDARMLARRIDQALDESQ